ncbi:MAG: TIGR04282 family arsenosugar biosynthesis glycosyltransferase [Candidatus Lokiarchaeota archaeon]
MNKKASIILIRNPILGKIKTRLAKDIGEENTLKVYRILLDYTKSVVTKVDCARLLFYSEFIDTNDIWEPNLFIKYVQIGSNLGERMSNAFKIALKDYEEVIIIGSDCYELRPEILTLAFDQLKSHDIVLGPAKDGGYYLLGLKKFYPQLFENKEWSTSTVFMDTLNDVKRLDLSIFLLPTLSDIDNVYDLKDSKFTQY